MKRKYWILAAAALSLAYFAVLAWYAGVRVLDPDEGYYPLAARLVAEGKAPYRDFQFPQGPLTPYVYSWVSAVHPQSIAAMRVVSAGLGALAVFLWGACLFSIKRIPPKIALAAFLVVLLNPYWIAWHTVVKTFAVADFLVSAAMVCFYLGFQSGRPRWYVLAGAALGLCATARGLYGPLLVFVLLWLGYLDWKQAKPPLRRSFAYLAGTICGAVPMLLSFAADPRALLFNNTQYRRLLDFYVTTSLGHRLRLYASGVHELALRGYFMMELLLAVVGAISLWKLRKKGDDVYTHQEHLYFQFAFWMMVVYGATCLAPIPMFAQYFDGPILPFLIFFVLEGLRVAYRAAGKWMLPIAAIAAFLCWHGVSAEVSQYARRSLQMPAYREVAQAVRDNSREGATVLSLWPGYVFESGRRCFPGAEDEFGYQVARVAGPEASARYHLISGTDIVRALAAGIPDIYIPADYYRYLSFTMSNDEQQALSRAVDANYVLAAKVDDVEIYRRRASK